MRQVLIRREVNNLIKRRTGIVLSAVALIVTTTLALSYANPINQVLNITPMSTGEAKVPAAHADILRVDWDIDPSSSTVEAVLMIVQNTDPAKEHTFDIVVQVSCTSSHGRPFICAGGEAENVGPIPPGGTGAATVGLDFAIDPERTQIDDLSFIITEHPGLI